MNDPIWSSVSPDRRMVITSGVGALALLAGFGGASNARADATPEAASMVGMFGVTRSYVLAEGANVDDLNAIVEGFVAIVSDNPGFLSYHVIHDPETRGYVTVGVFDNAESAEASVAEAAQFVQDNNLASYFVEPKPVIVQGEIVISAGG